MTLDVAKRALESAGLKGSDLHAVGITSQRETAVAWDARSGEPLRNGIVWQDRRTARRCDELREAVTSRCSESAPAWCSTPTSPARSTSGCCAKVASIAAPARDDRLVARLQAHEETSLPSGRVIVQLWNRGQDAHDLSVRLVNRSRRMIGGRSKYVSRSRAGSAQQARLCAPVSTSSTARSPVTAHMGRTCSCASAAERSHQGFGACSAPPAEFANRYPG